MKDTDVVILGGARTPMAEYNGHFAEIPETELGAHAARAALEKAGVSPDWIHHTVFGNALQTSPNAIYGARHVALKAGIPVDRPALTVNRICGSGLQSIVTAGHLIRLAEAEVVLAGGMENMSMAPYVLRSVRSGWPKLGAGKMEDALLAALLDSHSGCTMADTAENLAHDMDIPRLAMDEYAVRSQECANAFHASGRAAEEIVPVEVPQRRGPLVVADDDHRRPGTTIEALGRLRPAFRKDGVVTG
ncbi:MAG: acetyl-CoA C-acyltransferase, partial [Acidobacteriota bacterium]